MQMMMMIMMSLTNGYFISTWKCPNHTGSNFWRKSAAKVRSVLSVHYLQTSATHNTIRPHQTELTGSSCCSRGCCFFSLPFFLQKTFRRWNVKIHQRRWRSNGSFRYYKQMKNNKLRSDYYAGNDINYCSMGGSVAQWLGRWLVIERLRVRLPASALPSNNSGQVVHTHVPLSPSSIIWYRPKGGDALQLGR